MTTGPTSSAGRTREPANDLAELIRAQINSGELEAGARLPTARGLAEEHDVALATAVRAVGMLRDEGVVTTVHGRGSYVAARQEIVRGDATRYRNPDPSGLAPNRQEAAAGGFRDEVDRDDTWTQPAPADLARRMGIEEGAELSAVRYRWLVSGVPTQVSTQWEPLEITGGTDIEQPSSKERGQPAAHARFAQLGWTGTRVVEEYRSRLPVSEERDLLEVPSHVAVLEIQRLTYATKGGTERVIEAAKIIARGDRTVIRSESPTAWPSGEEKDEGNQ